MCHGWTSPRRGFVFGGFSACREGRIEPLTGCLYSGIIKEQVKDYPREAMDKTILKKAENQVRQQLFGGLALLVAALMVANISGLVKAVSSDVTNVTFNVNAGAFSIDNVPTAITFPLMNFGESNAAHVATPEVDDMAITDYRGSATAWSVAVTANNLQAGTNEIASSKISIKNGTKRNIQNLDTNRVAIGSNGTLNGDGTTLVNGSTQASGITGFDNAALTLNVSGSEVAGAYGAIVTYTLT